MSPWAVFCSDVSATDVLKRTLRDHGEHGAGRLTLVLRPIAGRASAEWYALFYRRWKHVKAKLGS
jgi:hypothetical protein